jgi:SAM-dependent methyltransferase
MADLPRISRRTMLRLLASATALVAGGRSALAGAAPSNFKRIYGNAEDRRAFLLFLRNVFHLYPEAKFHALIVECTDAYGDDEAIYRRVAERLPEITPRLSAFTYALPALRKQKAEMATQTLDLLGERRKAVGYAEIGTTGRYLNGLKRKADIRGPIYVVNDVAPIYSAEDIIERGQVRKVGTYVDMTGYPEFDRDRIPPASVELVTNYIGFHHAPADKLDGFVHAIHRILKPGGRLVVRDHDVDGERMDAMVGLAHDVFNAGVGLTWEENAGQIRNFRSLRDLTGYLEARGFERAESMRFQDGDPTKNGLMVFTKPREARTT